MIGVPTRLSTVWALCQAWAWPLIFFQCYLIVGVFLFFLGPWPWPVTQGAGLLAFLLASQAAIAIGYLLYDPLKSPPSSSLPSGRASPAALLTISAVVSLLLLVPTSLVRTGSAFPNLIEGITNTGAAYNARQVWLEQANPYAAVEYLRILCSPFLISLLPWLVVYGARVSWMVRGIALLGVCGVLVNDVATGTNKGIADLLVTLPWLFLLIALRGELRIRVPRWLLCVLLLAAFALFLDFFGRGQLQREGGVGEFGVFNSGKELIFADRDHSVSRQLPLSGKVIFESLTRYLGQGYFALEQSFDLEAGRTFGAGHSMFIARNANRLFDTERFTQESLPAQLEQHAGWGAQALWHSIYPWLASDLGFALTIFLMGALGWLLSAVWLDALRTLRPSAVALLQPLLILFYYIPANNQIMQSGESAAGFLILLVWWGLSRWRSSESQDSQVTVSEGLRSVPTARRQ